MKTSLQAHSAFALLYQSELTPSGSILLLPPHAKSFRLIQLFFPGCVIPVNKLSGFQIYYTVAKKIKAMAAKLQCEALYNIRTYFITFYNYPKKWF